MIICSLLELLLEALLEFLLEFLLEVSTKGYPREPALVFGHFGEGIKRHVFNTQY